MSEAGVSALALACITPGEFDAEDSGMGMMALCLLSADGSVDWKGRSKSRQQQAQCSMWVHTTDYAEVRPGYLAGVPNL